MKEMLRTLATPIAALALGASAAGVLARAVER
jgi:hypothetical protein